NGTYLTVDTIPLLDPVNGTVTVFADGGFTYIPAPGFNGVDTFIVNVCDSSGMCTVDTTYINVSAVNDPPITLNDTVSTNEEIPVNGNILTAGDYDTDTTGLSVTFVPVFSPSNGIIIIDSAGNYTYTP